MASILWIKVAPVYRPFREIGCPVALIRPHRPGDERDRLVAGVDGGNNVGRRVTEDTCGTLDAALSNV